MAGKHDPLQATIDRLYGLPLDEFTPARDAASKERRAEKDRGGAETLRQLRKPNLVAWSLNRVRRSDTDAVDELIAAGERLQEAQRQLVSGGERGLLRDASADERAHVGRVAGLAAAELAAAGHPADAGTQSKLFATLHAAAASAEIRGLLSQGRLIRDHELSDLGLGDGAELAAPSTAVPARQGELTRPPARTRTRGAESPAPNGPSAAQRAKERKARTLKDRLDRARQRSVELAEEAEQSRQRAGEAQRTAREAAKQLERAEAAAAKAAASAERAADTVSTLEAELAAVTDDT
jgi:hypothetical protein